MPVAAPVQERQEGMMSMHQRRGSLRKLSIDLLKYLSLFIQPGLIVLPRLRRSGQFPQVCKKATDTLKMRKARPLEGMRKGS